MTVQFRNCTVIKPIIRTVCEICSNWQFYYQKNVHPVSIVKFEFLGYNGNNSAQFNANVLAGICAPLTVS